MFCFYCFRNTNGIVEAWKLASLPPVDQHVAIGMLQVGVMTHIYPANTNCILSAVSKFLFKHGDPPFLINIDHRSFQWRYYQREPSILAAWGNWFRSQSINQWSLQTGQSFTFENGEIRFLTGVQFYQAKRAATRLRQNQHIAVNCPTLHQLKSLWSE